ncbi:uncharacterized protein LOC119894810 isoform X1 [Micropterus salmoides]|uniref:uncharacterized protein LOC119894810 isoform X1 n=1 Tax=Micropterus salmoides TaxID=27706 RepID=UPI0018EE27FD|nr:uncharacterized protein LOC119894810 isoform X1 [Micropterus salmoides]
MLAVSAIADMERIEKVQHLTNGLRSAERFHCPSPVVNIDQYPELKDFLPKEYQYHVCSYKAVNSDSDHIDFEATLRMCLKSKEEILVWLKSMPVTWRVDHSRPTKGSKIIFKKEYRCLHNIKPRTKTSNNDRPSKNTGCPAKLKVTLARTEVFGGRQSRSTDPHIPEYPILMEIKNVHNHNIYVVEYVRHRDVGSKAIEQLTKLFEAGHSPSSALGVLKYDVQVKLLDDYPYALADRSICPDLQFCYRLYQQIIRKKKGGTGSGCHLTSELCNHDSESSMAATEELNADDTLEADSQCAEVGLHEPGVCHNGAE